MVSVASIQAKYGVPAGIRKTPAARPRATMRFRRAIPRATCSTRVTLARMVNCVAGRSGTPRPGMQTMVTSWPGQMPISCGASWSVHSIVTLYCRNCARPKYRPGSPAIARQRCRLVDRLKRHGDAAHRVLTEINGVDREQRIGRHQAYRDGLRPPARTCANAAERLQLLDHGRRCAQSADGRQAGELRW